MIKTFTENDNINGASSKAETGSVKSIDTRLVYGFLDAGKTTYISESIRDDLFYKRGSTLILCFEEGETEYDEEFLSEKNTSVAYYDSDAYENGAGKESETDSVRRFCLESIEAYYPDRIYVEMNTMMQDLREMFPACMRVTVVVTFIDWATMPLYFTNFKKMINQMVAESHQITFRGCPSKELLAPYSQAFRLMNQRASYLRQDPMGYHEKAFDMFLPFSLEESDIVISDEEYLPLWLDALDHPEHYQGKTIHFSDPLEVRREEGSGRLSAGHVVMVCCMADLQFMAFQIEGDVDVPDKGWITLDAAAETATDGFGQRKVKLKPLRIKLAQPPKNMILGA